MSNWIEFPILQELNELIQEYEKIWKHVDVSDPANNRAEVFLRSIECFYQKLDGFLMGIERGIEFSKKK